MNKIINADALEALRTLPDSCCRTCYWIRLWEAAALAWLQYEKAAILSE